MDVTISAFIDFDHTSNRTDLEIVQSEKINGSLHIVFGANLRKGRVRSFCLLYNEENQFFGEKLIPKPWKPTRISVSMAWKPY